MSTDQSNAPLPDVVDQSSTVGFASAPQTPADLINKSARDASSIMQFAFPNEQIKYYMTFNMAKYNFGAGNAGRTLAASETIGQIRLPLPDSLRDLQSVDWTQSNLLAQGFAAAGGILGGAAGLIAGAHSQSVAAVGKSALGVAGVGSIAAGLATAAGMAVRLTGIAPNQFVTVLLNGPQYKQHNFSWSLAAKTPQEAENIRQIIQVFNNCMAPGLGGSGLYWTFPNIFYIKFVPNPEYIFEFKPSVLVNFAVDYAGGHVPSFLRSDSATNNLNAPESVTIQAQFLEIEYWKNGDFNDITNFGSQESPTIIAPQEGIPAEQTFNPTGGPLP